MTDRAEVKISGALVRAALADEATAALPDGCLKSLLLTLEAAFGSHATIAVAELVVRYPKLGQGHPLPPTDEPCAA